MYLNIEIEVYQKKDGTKVVYIANDGSSGCKYEFETPEELKQIINDYVADVVDYEFEDGEPELDIDPDEDEEDEEDEE